MPLELEWYIDVQDTARLHVAAVINPDVQNERIFGFADPFNWKYVSSPTGNKVTY